MSLLDDIESSISHRAGFDCPVRTILISLDEPDRSQLQTALGRADIPHTAISAGLKAHGHRIDARRVSEHRRGNCTCH